MTVATFENLDLACAQIGKQIAEKPSKELKELEKLVTCALGILQEQGVYALFLYLESSKDDKAVSKKLHDFLKQTPQQKPLCKKESRDILESIRNDLATDLDQLLLAKELLSQTLVYARWHARLREDEDKQQDEDKEASGGDK